MGISPVQRIVVMGPPGSGKSTMARHLGARFGVPVFHLDQAWHRPGWVEVPLDEFRTEVERIAALPTWVIDGNYTATIECRFRVADMVVYLDMPTWLSMLRVIRRIVTSYGTVRPDSAPGCPERLDLVFLYYIWTWNRQRRDRNLALVESFGGRKIILRGRRAVRRFLAE
jgi:adenylate kinase family enzyme